MPSSVSRDSELTDHVGDARDQTAAQLDLAQCRQRVGGLAALRDGDVQRVPVDDRICGPPARPRLRPSAGMRA